MEAERRGGGGSGSRVRAAPGKGVHLAPPLPFCGSGSADSGLTFLFPVAVAAFCSPFQQPERQLYLRIAKSDFLLCLVRGGLTSP